MNEDVIAGAKQPVVTTWDDKEKGVVVVKMELPWEDVAARNSDELRKWMVQAIKRMIATPTSSTEIKVEKP